MTQTPIQMPNYMRAAEFKTARREQAMGEMNRMIQQYKLDAENERRVAGGALATLGAEMENNPDGVNSLAQSNPEFGKALKLLNEGKAKKKDMQIISASLAANTQARAQKLQEDNLLARTDAQKFKNAFDKRTEELNFVAKQLANDAQKELIEYNKLRNEYQSTENSYQKDKINAQLNWSRAKLYSYRAYEDRFPSWLRGELDKARALRAGQPAARTFEDANKDMEVVRSSAISVDGEGSTFGALIDANPPGSDFWENEKIPTQTRTLYNRYLGLLMQRDQLGRQPIVIGDVAVTPDELAEIKQAQDDYGAAWNALPEDVQMGLLKEGYQETAAGMSMQELRGRLRDLNELLEREKAEADVEYEEEKKKARRQLLGLGSSGQFAL